VRSRSRADRAHDRGMSEETPDLLDVLELFEERMLAGIHTALPGRIEQYDPATQRADVQPLIRRRIPKAGTDRREWVYEELPLIPSVRVIHPRGGEAFVHMPINPGDFVLLVFCETGIGHWEAGDGSMSDAGDERRHHLAHAVAIPGFFPATKNIPSVDANASELVVGFEGGATVRVRRPDPSDSATNTIVLETTAQVILGGETGAQFMARADRVNTELARIRDVLTSWTVTPNDGGAALKAAATAAFTGAQSTAADQVKGK
jgi:hypothetical protein